MVFEHEKLDDIGIGGYKIIQDKRGFCFGSDAVLLAAFTRVPKGARVMDLCTGTGIIPVLIWAKQSPASIDAVELLEDTADMAARTMTLNGLSDIRVRCADIKDAPEIYGRGVFDVVTCNPPYMHSGGGLVNPSGRLAAARHEIFCTLEDVVRTASLLLRNAGRFFMVHRADRLCDCICTLREHRLEPKRMSLVYPNSKKAPNLALIEALLNGKPQLKVTEPIFMYDDNGVYLQQI